MNQDISSVETFSWAVTQADYEKVLPKPWKGGLSLKKQTTTAVTFSKDALIAQWQPHDFFGQFLLGPAWVNRSVYAANVTGERVDLMI